MIFYFDDLGLNIIPAVYCVFVKAPFSAGVGIRSRLLAVDLAGKRSAAVDRTVSQAIATSATWPTVRDVAQWEVRDVFPGGFAAQEHRHRHVHLATRIRFEDEPRRAAANCGCGHLWPMATMITVITISFFKTRSHLSEAMI